MEINPDQSRMHIIQGVANEVLAASITIFLILSYLIYSTISFFKYMPQRSFNLSENFRNFFSQNNPIQNPLNYNQNQQPNVQNEFITQNNCSICLNHIQYEITTSCAHLFCGIFFKFYLYISFEF